MSSVAHSALIKRVNTFLKIPEDEELNNIIRHNLPPATAVQRADLIQMISEREAVQERLELAVKNGQDPGGFYSCASLYLSGQIQIFKSPLSPIKRIPVEILAHIFEIVVDSAYYGGGLMVQVLSLSQTYQRRVSPRTAAAKRFDAALAAELTSLWFQRAAPHPVLVSVSAYEHPSSSPHRQVLLHASRIAELTLLRVGSKPFPSIPQDPLTTLSFPVLQKLEVKGAYNSSYPRQDHIEPILPFFAHLRAPQLTEVSLDLVGTVLPNFDAFGHQLRRLDLSMKSEHTEEEEGLMVNPMQSRANVLGVLQHCTQLEYLGLIITRQALQNFDGTIRLERLELLFFELGFNASHVDITPLLSTLALPALKEFDATLPDNHRVWDWPVWMSFKHRSGFRLRRFAFSNVRQASPDQLWAFLLDMDTLESLYLSEFTEGIEFLHHFKTFAPSRPFLPSLQSLTIMISPEREVRPTPDLDELVEGIVRSRWWSDSSTSTKSYRRWTDVCIARQVSIRTLADDDYGELLSPQASQRMDAIGGEGLMLDFSPNEY
ncbi:hypothetical protein V5O48_003305 [Marasmius crinis-equi]|uniref:F-box domain-containing protein n=1 Tax=Marasmius crinis-equi TaxID=585013 RepID=A0ABR3FTP2_9AGAR